MRGLYDLSGVPPEAFSPTQPYILVGVVGCVFWAIAYVLAIRLNQVQRTYSLPAAAVCLNIGQETLTAFVFPDPVPLYKWFFVAWFLLDLVIVVQLFRYGPQEQPDPEIAKRFRLIATIRPICADSLLLPPVGRSRGRAWLASAGFYVKRSGAIIASYSGAFSPCHHSPHGSGNSRTGRAARACAAGAGDCPRGPSPARSRIDARSGRGRAGGGWGHHQCDRGRAIRPERAAFDCGEAPGPPDGRPARADPGRPTA